MAVGRVKWFNDEKGYGFIVQEGGGDVFLHFSALTNRDAITGRRTVADGAAVEFDLVNAAKGLQAANVVVTSGPSSSTW